VSQLTCLLYNITSISIIIKFLCCFRSGNIRGLLSCWLPWWSN